MGKTRPPYPPEFRRQLVELVRSGRSPEALSREFEPTAQSIRNWVVQADIDEGRSDGLTTAECAVSCGSANRAGADRASVRNDAFVVTRRRAQKLERRPQLCLIASSESICRVANAVSVVVCSFPLLPTAAH